MSQAEAPLLTIDSVQSAREAVAKYEAAWREDDESIRSAIYLAWALSSLISYLEFENQSPSCSTGGCCTPRAQLPEVIELSKRIIALTDKALAQHADHIPSLHYRYRAFYALDRYKDALGMAERVLAVEPSNSNMQCGMANCLYYLNRHDDSAKAYERAWNLDPANSEALKWAHTSHQLAGDDENADRIARLGIEHFPDHTEFARIAFMHRLKEGRFEDAVALARESALARPEDYAPRVAEGHALLKLDRREEAINAYREAIRLAPARCAGYVGLLKANGSGISQDHVRTIIEAALSAGDLSGVEFESLSNWATENGYQDDALRILDRMCESNPHSNGIHARHRAEVLKILGRTEEADVQYAVAADFWEEHLDGVLALFTSSPEGISERERESIKKTHVSILKEIIPTIYAARRADRLLQLFEVLESLDPECADTMRAELS